MDIEEIEKRIQTLEKNQEKLDTSIKKILGRILFVPRSELFHYVARAVKNECNLDLLKEYLIENDIIDYEKYMQFWKDHELTRTYQDENRKALTLKKHFLSMLKNPAPDETLLNYVNHSNLLIYKKRLETQRKILLERGIEKDSEYVKGLDDSIDEIKREIGSMQKEKSEPIKQRDYYVKKVKAQEIFENIVSKRDEIVERIREMPSISDIHLEPNNKLLYDEVISSYWFGKFNASICMLCVLLESFLREIYNLRTREFFNGTFRPLINKCKSEKYITEDEQSHLLAFADDIRNKYLHARLNEILTEITVETVKIDFTISGKKSESTYSTEESLPALRDMFKPDLDRYRSKELIIKWVEIIGIIAKRHKNSNWNENEISESDV